MEDDKKFHQRIQQDRKPSLLPFSTKRKIENGIRCAVSTGICIIAGHYWSWANSLTYLSPALSPITTNLYFGQWLENLWKIAYSGIITAILGALIGRSGHIPILFIALQLIGLIWIEKCSLWDRLCKVIGALSFIVAALYGILSNWSYSAKEIMSMVVGMLMMSTLISGVTFFVVPYPALAYAFVQTKLTKVCRQLSAAIFALTRAFCASEHVDLLNTEVEFILVDIEETLNSLDPLIGYAATESAALNSMHHISGPAALFVKQARKMIQEIRWMRSSLQHLASNRTQARFVRYLRIPLLEVSAEVDLLMGITASYFADMCCRPKLFASFSHLADLVTFICGKLGGGVDRLGGSEEDITWRQTTAGNRERAASLVVMMDETDADHLDDIADSDDDDNDESNESGKDHFQEAKRFGFSFKWRKSDSSKSEVKPIASGKASNFTQEYAAASKRLSRSMRKLMGAFQRSRIKCFFEWRMYRAENANALKTELRRRKDSSENQTTAGNEFPVPVEGKGHGSSAKFTASESNNVSNVRTRTNTVGTETSYEDMMFDEAARKLYIEETESLSLDNYGPRSSYLSRMVALKDVINASIDIFEPRPQDMPATLHSFVRGTAVNVYTYLQSIPSEWAQVYKLIAAYYHGGDNGIDSSSIVGSQQMTKQAAARRSLLKLCKTYIQPIKISLAITLTSIFVIFPAIGNNSYLFSQNALWATIVIALVRQDSTASSFLQSYQRLEGTVIGALFAFAIFSVLKCASQPEGRCEFQKTTPVLIIWMFLCNFFKEGARHGYAATVASLTPVILLLGPTTGTVEGAWQRVMMTFLGIVIYLLVDNTIFPNRTDRSVRRSVIHSVEETGFIFHHCMSAFEVLMSRCGSTVTIVGNESLGQGTLAPTDARHHSVSPGTGKRSSRLLTTANAPLSSSPARDSILSDSSPVSSSSPCSNPIDIESGLISDTESPVCKAYLVADSPDTPGLGKLEQVKGNKKAIKFAGVSTSENESDEIFILEESSDEDGDEESAMNKIAELTSVSSPPALGHDKLATDTPKQPDLFKLHIDAASACLGTLTRHIKDQSDRINIGMFEPEVFRRAFPLQEYANLGAIFKKIQHKCQATINGIITLSHVVADAQSKYSAEDIKFHVDALRFMTVYIAKISISTQAAMKRACQAMHRLFGANDMETDLTELVVLARGLNNARAVCEHYFKYEYSSHTAVQRLDPMFTTNFHNVLTCVSRLASTLSSLGAALHRVREVEIRAAT